MKLSVGKIRPPLDCRAKLVIAGSISVEARIGVVVTAMPRVDAAAPIDRRKEFDCGDVSGLNITATLVKSGAVCFKSLSHLPPIENSYAVKPVILPPGFARLVTKPCSTGSDTDANTTGTVLVTSRAIVRFVVEAAK